MSRWLVPTVVSGRLFSERRREMKNILLALAAMATLGLTASSAFADTGAATPQTLDAKVQHAVLQADNVQGELQQTRWGGRYWGYRGFYPYQGYYGYRPYYYGGYYRPYWGGYYGYRPYYYGGFYRPYYRGYWWY